MKIGLGVAQIGGAQFISAIKCQLQSAGFEIVWLLNKKPEGEWLKHVDPVADRFHVLNSDEREDRLSQLNLSCLIVNIFSNFETRLILEARELGIPSIGFLDFWTRLMDRIKYRDKLVFPDRLLVLDEPTRDFYAKLGMNTDYISLSTNPHWNKTTKRAQRPLGEKILVPFQDSTPAANVDFGEWLTSLARISAKVNEGNELKIEIKWHPTFRVPINLERISDQLGISVVHELNVWEEYFCTVGLYSSILFEAALREIPACSFCENEAFFLNFSVPHIDKFTNAQDLAHFLKTNFQDRTLKKGKVISSKIAQRCPIVQTIQDLLRQTNTI